MTEDADIFLPFFLEDKTGLLTGSIFLDFYDRIGLSYEKSLRGSDDTRTTYKIYPYSQDSGRGQSPPLVVLSFGSNDSLGTINFPSQRRQMLMEDYLTKISPLSPSTTRKFTASDGQQYQWVQRPGANQLWACTDSAGVIIADYCLKIEREPPYMTSGCSLNVEEPYPHLAAEMLASLMIMRHIAEHDL